MLKNMENNRKLSAKPSKAERTNIKIARGMLINPKTMKHNAHTLYWPAHGRECMCVSLQF